MDLLEAVEWVLITLGLSYFISMIVIFFGVIRLDRKETELGKLVASIFWPLYLIERFFIRDYIDSFEKEEEK